MRVLISGYYGFGNAGDEALLSGLIGGLQLRGHTPLVLSADPRATRELHGVGAYHRVRALLPALLAADALVSGGGGLLQDRTSSKSLSYYLAVIRLARSLGKRVVVYGQSVGPLSAAGRDRIQRALAAIPLAVRDLPSLELLAELGLAGSLVADPALLLEPPQLSGGSRPVALVPRAGHPQLTDTLAMLGQHLRERGAETQVVALHPAHDAHEAKRLVEQLPGSSLRWAGAPREALAGIDGASLVASARLHGLILATVTSTPFLGLIYDPKVSGYLREAGRSGLEHPVDCATLLSAAAECEPLPTALRDELILRAERGLDWLDESLRREARER